MNPEAAALGAIEALLHPVLVMDGEGRLVLANAALWRETGADPSRFPPGTPLRDILRLLAFRGLLGPGDPAQLAAEALAQDRSTASTIHRRSADGARMSEVTSLPLPGGGFVLCLVDITALQRAEGQARAAAALFERVLDAQRGGVALFDDAHRLQLHNPAYRRHSGATPEILAGRPLLRTIMEGLWETGEFLTSKDREHYTSGITADRRKMRIAERERADGSVVRFVSTPLPDGGFLIETDDVTELRRAEDEARRRAAILDGVLEALPHGICVWGPDRRVAMFNAAYVRLMEGASLQVGDTLEDVIRRRAEAGEYGPGEAAAVYAREMGRDFSRPQERRRLRPNGTALDVRTAPLPDGGHVSVVTDVTALWQAEDEARRRAAVLEAAMASMRHGLVVYGPDRKVISANELAGVLAGHKPGDVRPGQSLDELLVVLRDGGQLGPDADRITRDAMELDRSKPYRGVRETPEGRVLEVSSDPTPDGGFVVTHVDITALARAQAEAERRAGMLQVMLDNMRHGICLFDAEGRVVAANALAAHMTGLAPEVLRPGRTILELRQEQIRAGEYGSHGDIEATLGERMMDPLRAPDRYIRRRASGRIIEVTTDRTPDGGYVRTYSDVTEDWRIRDELEAARSAAETASDAKSRFLATMSHELRTPLNAIMGFSEVMKDEIFGPHTAPVYREYANDIYDSGRHLLQLINEILDLSRIEAGRYELVEERAHLGDIAQDCQRLLTLRADSKGLEVSMDIDADLPQVWVDVRAMRQICLNLLSNAIKFTPKGGRISLAVGQAPDGGQILVIRDTGPGIPADEIPKVLQAFGQGSLAHETAEGGTGLGLPIVKSLIELHGGTFDLTSELRKGTEVRVLLPQKRVLATVAPLQPLGAERHRQPTPPPTRKPRLKVTPRPPSPLRPTRVA